MRCTKCGYYSFDYLSECKKCHADLRGAREDLGLLDVEPTIPEFLEALLGGGSSKAPGVVLGSSEADLPEQAEAADFAGDEMDIPDIAEDEVLIDLVDDAPQEVAFSEGQQTVEIETPGSDEANGAGTPSGKFSLDLIDEDLDKLLRDINAEPEIEISPQPEAAAMDIDAEAETLDLSDIDLGDLEIELEENEPSGSGSAQATNAGAADALELSAEPEEDLELELKDDELDGLLLEIEEDDAHPPSKRQQ